MVSPIINDPTNPPWAGRLVLQINAALAALSTASSGNTTGNTTVAAAGYVTAGAASPDANGLITLETTLTNSDVPSGTPTPGANCTAVTGSNSSMTVTQAASTDNFTVNFSSPWADAPTCTFAPASAAAASLAYQSGTTYATTTTGAVTLQIGVQTTSTPILWFIQCAA